MEFNSNKSIYNQISDLICENILLGKFHEEDRLDSVRDMAGNLEVNPNTVMRSYSFLQDEGIIYNKRGIGYFISTGAVTRILDIKKRTFVDEELPSVFRQADIYGISPDEIKVLYVDYKKGVENEEK
ncbi:MAG: GntR family transcriptional regulator [Spirochaetales bacterium]|nr:GntR family transcriptional regulator [Spirochaetales bacterium]